MHLDARNLHRTRQYVTASDGAVMTRVAHTDQYEENAGDAFGERRIR